MLQSKLGELEKEYLLYKFKYPDNCRCFLRKFIWKCAKVTYDMIQVTT